MDIIQPDVIQDIAKSRESGVKIIAEIGINHNGSVEICKKMMLLAKFAGVDLCKNSKKNS